MFRPTGSLEETKELGVAFETPKNDSSARTIGIDAGLAGLLKRHKTAQADDALRAPAQEC
jgi:hypothetical protein